jgi:hypothetical protein
MGSILVLTQRHYLIALSESTCIHEGQLFEGVPRGCLVGKDAELFYVDYLIERYTNNSASSIVFVILKHVFDEAEPSTLLH